MMKVHNFFFILGEPASGVLLTTINLDRFIAVAWPIVRFAHSFRNFILHSLQTYYNMSFSYTFAIIVPFYLLVLGNALIGYYISWTAEQVVVVQFENALEET